MRNRYLGDVYYIDDVCGALGEMLEYGFDDEIPVELIIQLSDLYFKFVQLLDAKGE